MNVKKKPCFKPKIKFENLKIKKQDGQGKGMLANANLMAQNDKWKYYI